MYWQREYIRENISMTLNDTYRLDLPENGLLGSILLRVSGSEASGYGQSGGDWRIIDELSKINVVLNGATVCKSLTGYELQALTYYDQGVIPPGVWRNYATNTQFEYLLINFGRWLHDNECGLDLSRFANVELQIENSATSSDFSDLTVSIQANYLRDAMSGSFRGYLRTEEWRNWTTVQAETKYLELPTEHILRRIMLQAIPAVDANNVEDTNMANLMDDIELALDTGAVRVYKGGIDDLMRENYLDMGRPVVTGGFPYHTADKGIDISLGYVLFGAWGAGSQDGAGAATVATLESGRTSFTQKAETYEADSPIGAAFFGIAPFETALFRFDEDPDPSSWLDTNKRKTVKLDIHTRDSSSADNGRNAVVLDRYVNQP